MRDKERYCGKTPLHWAAAGGHTDIVKLLLDAGADTDVEDEYGVTPLFLAASKGDTYMVKLLLDAGADMEVKEKMAIRRCFRRHGLATLTL